MVLERLLFFFIHFATRNGISYRLKSSNLKFFRVILKLTEKRKKKKFSQIVPSGPINEQNSSLQRLTLSVFHFLIQ
jgi:hypothetical protein